MLESYRAEHGPIFALQTGPVKQVWVGDPEVLRRVYETPACCGRPVSFEDPFGEFLFLTREPEVAAGIKERQQRWLDANLRADVVKSAAEAAIAELWPQLDSAAARATPAAWPEDEVKMALYAAVTRAFLGEAGLLSSAELKEFMGATREYAEMRTKSKSGGGGEKQLPPGAARILAVLEPALRRAGRGDEREALPLMVAASIGGAEIFPTLLHWIALAFARDLPLQDAAASAAAGGDLAGVMRVVYAVMRTTAYSVALGPPRKVLADAVVDGMAIPEGALLFALHPAIADRGLGRRFDAVGEVLEEADAFAGYAFGVGPRGCLGQRLTEALLPAVVAALLRRYRLAGLGSGEVRGELEGQLIRPADPPGIVWQRAPR